MLHASTIYAGSVGKMRSGKIAQQFNRRGNTRQSIFPGSGHQPVPSLCTRDAAALLKTGMSSPRLSKGCSWTTHSRQLPEKISSIIRRDSPCTKRFRKRANGEKPIRQIY